MYSTSWLFFQKFQPNLTCLNQTIDWGVDVMSCNLIGLDLQLRNSQIIFAKSDYLSVTNVHGIPKSYDGKTIDNVRMDGYEESEFKWLYEFLQCYVQNHVFYQSIDSVGTIELPQIGTVL